MESISKSFSLLIVIVLVASSLIMVESASAQSIPKPAVPEFTVHLVGPSFARNTTYSLDSNTGQIVANIGTNKYGYVILAIKNQLFNPSFGSLYYNIQIKNQNTPYKNWTVVTYDGPNPKQTTDSDFTNISLRIEGQWGVQSFAGIQTDIEVQAMLGNFNYENGLFTGEFVFHGVTSDWSNTQTINVPANVPLSSTSPNPTPTPTMPNSGPTSSPTPSPSIPEIPPWTIPLLITVMVESAGLLFYHKQNKTKATQP